MFETRGEIREQVREKLRLIALEELRVLLADLMREGLIELPRQDLRDVYGVWAPIPGYYQPRKDTSELIRDEYRKLWSALKPYELRGRPLSEEQRQKRERVIDLLNENDIPIPLAIARTSGSGNAP